MSVALAIAAGALYAAGVYLIMRRALTRIVLGLALLAHGANLLILAAGGGSGTPPFAGEDTSEVSDPLPQALILTAIVIGFGMTVFLLGLAHRSWKLRHSDQVEDDVEDRRIAGDSRWSDR